MCVLFFLSFKIALNLMPCLVGGNSFAFESSPDKNYKVVGMFPTATLFSFCSFQKSLSKAKETSFHHKMGAPLKDRKLHTCIDIF